MRLRSSVSAVLGARIALLLATILLVCASALFAAPERALAADENRVDPQQRPDSSFIYDTEISALDSADTYYDGQTVQVVGEAVGDIINAQLDGSYQWVNLVSEEQGIYYTVSVYMSKNAASRIDALGGYGVTGTTLQVRGTFHLVCPDHEGVTDIHATVVSVVDSGAHHPDDFVAEDFIPGIVAIIIGVALMLVFYRMRERQR